MVENMEDKLYIYISQAKPQKNHRLSTVAWSQTLMFPIMRDSSFLGKDIKGM